MASTPFSRLHPTDGYHVIEQSNNSELVLSVGLRQDGQQSFAVDDLHAVWSDSPVTADGHSRKNRMKELLDAVCRYFTAGGDWTELKITLAALRPAIPFGIIMPGWEYYDGYHCANISDDGMQIDVVYVHEWYEPGTDRMVRWMEGVYIDETLTKALYAKELEDEYSDSVRRPNSTQQAEEGGAQEGGAGFDAQPEEGFGSTTIAGAFTVPQICGPEADS